MPRLFIQPLNARPYSITLENSVTEDQIPTILEPYGYSLEQYDVFESDDVYHVVPRGITFTIFIKRFATEYDQTRIIVPNVWNSMTIAQLKELLEVYGYGDATTIRLILGSELLDDASTIASHQLHRKNAMMMLNR